MINEALIISAVTGLVVGVLAAIAAYLAAKGKGKQALAESNETLSAVSAEKYQLEKQLESVKQQEKLQSERLRQLELDQQKTTTTLESVEARKSDLEAELNLVKGSLNDAVAGRHAAEKANESAQTEVKELAKQQQELQSRLHLESEELKAERLEVSRLKAESGDISEKSKAFEVQAIEAQQQLTESKATITQLEEKRQALQNRFDSLNREHAELETSQKERDDSHAKQLAQFEEQKQALSKEFENLANKIFDEKGKTFSETSKSTMDDVLKPFREQVEGFQKRVNEVHSESIKGNATLDAEIKKVLDVGIRMSDEASGLATALKGDKKALGTWSEVQAELLLEMSGLHEGREFHREANYKTDDNKDQRPDFVINLPNDKHLIIDSKMSLNSYVEATIAETEEERLAHMKAHVQAIRKHVKDLSDKNYPKLKGINCPEYVFMFIGNEPAYLAAFDHEPNLFQEAYRKGIAIVTPNTLLSSLRIVSHLWSIDKQNSNTKELAEQASKVYDKLRVFVGKMEKLGGQLTTAQKTYTDSWNTLKDGNGSLSKQVAKFVDMGVAVKEKLPASVAEGSDIELLNTDATLIGAVDSEEEPVVESNIETEASAETE